MTNFVTAPLQNQFETVLVGELSSASAAPFDITVGTAIDFTPAAGGFYATLEPGTTKEEGLLISAVSGTTWTVATRGIPIAKAGTDTTTSHGGGAKIIISNHWEVYDDIATAIATKADVAGDTYTGQINFSGTDHAGVKMISLTTTQRNALTPANGMVVYDSTLGLLYQYAGGVWASIDTGTVTPNASETVAGKVEIATDAQFDAKTDTGETGALLSVLPSQIPATKAELTQLSGTTHIAEADTFFGLTDITGTEAETLTDGSDASALHTHGTACQAGSGTATNISASGNLDIDVTPLDSGDVVKLDLGIRLSVVNDDSADASYIAFYQLSGLVGGEYGGWYQVNTSATTTLPVVWAAYSPTGIGGAWNVAVTATSGTGHTSLTLSAPAWSGNNIRIAYTFEKTGGTGTGLSLGQLSVGLTATKLG